MLTEQEIPTPGTLEYRIQMMEEMERRFWGGNTLASFKTDIRDKGDSYLLEAELPGFQKEDIDIQLSDNNLTISAEHKTESEEKDQKGNFVRRERTWGSYSRSFDVSDIDTARIKAAYQNGILTLTLPKRTETAPSNRTVVIEATLDTTMSRMTAVK